MLCMVYLSALVSLVSLYHLVECTIYCSARAHVFPREYDVFKANTSSKVQYTGSRPRVDNLPIAQSAHVTTILDAAALRRAARGLCSLFLHHQLMNLARHSISATAPVSIFDARFDPESRIFTTSTPAGFAVYRTWPLQLIRKRGMPSDSWPY